jgi:hypothetical protein
MESEKEHLSLAFGASHWGSRQSGRSSKAQLSLQRGALALFANPLAEPLVDRMMNFDNYPGGAS